MTHKHNHTYVVKCSISKTCLFECIYCGDLKLKTIDNHELLNKSFKYIFYNEEQEE